jgi:UDP-N-acetylglucosamine 4-epimerase
VDNAVQANLLAATTENKQAINRVYNVAVGRRTTLNGLFELLRIRLSGRFDHLQRFVPAYREFRPGDVRHSEADITAARRLLGYEPTHQIEQGLDEALDWYVATSKAGRAGMLAC